MTLSGRSHAIAAAAAIAFGLIIGNSMPLLIAAFVTDGNASYVVAGNLVSAEFATMATVSLMLAPFVARVSLQRLAIAGAVGAIIGHGASALVVPTMAESPTALSLLRILAGAAGGVIVCAGNAAVARVSNPTRVYAVASLAGAAVSAGLAASLPTVFPDWRAAVLVALACAALLVALLTLGMHSDVASSRYPGSAPTALGKLTDIPAASSLLLATLVLSSSLGSLWAFVELLGTNLGFAPAAVGRILALNLLAGLGGGLAAAWMGERFGTWRPLLAGIGLLASCALILGLIRTLWPFGITMLAYGFGYFFTMTFLMSSAARLDATGRVAAATGGVLLVGFALGPFMGGHIAELYGTGVLGLAVSIGLIVALVLTWLSNTRRGVLCCPPCSRDSA